MASDHIVRLKKNEERRVVDGHMWIFSNEIESVSGEPGNGECVQVASSKGEILGVGLFNRNSLIAVRMLSREPTSDLTQLIRTRIIDADARRRSLGYTDVYRLVHGESDFLPGLIIDRYKDTFVIESFSAGIDALMETIVSVLDENFQPVRILEKSTSLWRTYESLETKVKAWKGEAGEVAVTVGGLTYTIHPLEDQKTGLFLDQAANRAMLESLSSGRAVLDCFCNAGGFAMHAARGGASGVTAVDISSHSIERARDNAKTNGLEIIRFVESDVFDFFRGNKNMFDIIVLDPPAFVKNRKSLPVGLKAYRKLNEAAMTALSVGGLLVSCSCSHHVSQSVFLDMLGKAAARQKKQLSVFSVTGAGKDHPVLLSMPETQYLTCVFAHVLPV